MEKWILPLTVVGIAALCLCCSPSPKEGAPVEPIKVVAPPIIDEANLDRSVSAADDFYRFANGGWMERNPLPGDRSRYGTFDQLAQQAQEQVKSLIADIAAGQYADREEARKIARFYQLGMDEARIEKQGLEPLKPWLEAVDKVQKREDLAALLARHHRHGLSGFFAIGVEQDAHNSEQVITQLYQGGLSLRDRDYYLEDSEAMKGIRSAFQEHVARMLVLTGTPEDQAAKTAAAVLDLETSLARISMNRNDQRDPHLTTNPMDLDGLRKLAPAFDWETYFKGLSYRPLALNVGQTDFFGKMGQLMKDTPLDGLKAYVRWHLIHRAAPYLTQALVNEDFHFFGQTFAGQQEIQPRWKRVLRATDEALSEAVGQLYVARFFPPQAKERMVKLVENLRVALGERIDKLDWMGPETKAKAREKLAALKVKVGYPDRWRDYSGLVVGDEGYWQNVLAGEQFNFDYQMAQADKPVQPHIWGMPPQMVNAYYSPNMNEICFPAAILQPPFFYLEGDDAVNYGAIGVVIGHEMTHGFDDQGRLYDRVGNLSSWWTDEDSKRFTERTDVLVNQFNQFDVAPGMKADGRFTLGENIADLGGLNIAYTAVQKAWKEQVPAENLEGFSPRQRFFLGYAHLWAQNVTEKEILRRTKTDPHSLGRLRVLGPLRNMPEFHAAFGVTEGAAMFLPEGERARIW